MVKFCVNVEYFLLLVKVYIFQAKIFFLLFVKRCFIFLYTLFSLPPHPHTPTFKQSIYIFVYTMYNVRRCKHLKKESDMYRFILCLKCVFVLNETMLVHCHNSIFILKAFYQNSLSFLS